ncbi:MAG: divalent-cation tolerance protein CutA [Rickettsiales bacterium]
MKPALLYVPVDTVTSAKKIARSLIGANLIVCANIIPAGISLFPWKGKIQEAHEVIMIIKTSKAELTKVKNAIKALHPYETPCIAEFNLESINKGFLNWMKRVLLN